MKQMVKTDSQNKSLISVWKIYKIDKIQNYRTRSIFFLISAVNITNY